MLRPRVLLLPFRLALAVRNVPLTYVIHDILYRLLDGALANALTPYQHIHEGGLVVYVVPISELHPVHVRRQGGKHRRRHSGLIEPRHVLRQQLHQRRQLLGHLRRRRHRPAASLDGRRGLQRRQHLLQPVGHPLALRRQRVHDLLTFLALRKSVIARYHLVEPLGIPAADMPQVARQLVRQRVPVARRRLLPVVEQLPVLGNDVLVRNPLVLARKRSF